ncbi:MAG: hypothetical protein ABSG15_00870 [FCB group bacterium]|jgi:hypothetical protein
MKKFITISVLLIALVLVCLPRFNQNDISILKNLSGKGEYSYKNNEGFAIYNTSPDVYEYILITEYFRGKSTYNYLNYPYTYRPGIPYLASILPFDPLTSLNLINLLFLLISLIFIIKTAKLLGSPFGLQVLSCILYIFSFPVFYYGTIGMVDAPLVTLLFIGLYLLLKEKWLLLSFLFLIGSLIKETIIILLPVIFIYMVIKNRLNWKYYVWFSIYIILYLVFSYFAHHIIPIENKFKWMPSFKTVLENISRIRTYISFSLAFGIPGILSLFAISYYFKYKLKQNMLICMTLFTGLIFSFLLFLFSIISAYSDGRFIWTSYPFTIPLSIYFINLKKPKFISKFLLFFNESKT